RKFERDKHRRGHLCLGLTAALVGWSEIAYAINSRNLGSYINVYDLHQSDEAFRNELIAEGVYCGLLVRDEDTVDDVRFSHHRLQEFFAARYLSMVPQHLNWLNLLDDPRWRETILNLAAMSGESAPIRALGEALGQVAIDTCRSTALLQSA